MNPIAYVKAMLPSFEKDRVLDDIRATRDEIKQTTLPAYKSAADTFKTWKFKSAVLKPQMHQFSRMVKNADGNIVVAIGEGLGIVLTNLDHAESLVERTFNEEVTSASMTYLRTQLLQFIDCISFVSKYSRKYLNYVYICELAEYEESNTKISTSLLKVEIDWLEANFVNFCNAFACVTGSPSDITKALDKIPDVIVSSDNANTMEETMGATRLDPLLTRFIPVWLNPVYFVGLRVAEWQARRYKAAKEELRLLQLRRLNLERVMAKNPDPVIQREIEILETRCQGLNYDIAELERKNHA